MQSRIRDLKTFRDLEVYQRAVTLQREVFESSRSWPRYEAYSLTNQVRRSSRAIGANIAESWAKRRYPAHFLSKLTDADGELQETEHWLETALQCRYVSCAQINEWLAEYTKVGRMLGSMMAKHEKFCVTL
jgi:four helix bundle protein